MEAPKTNPPGENKLHFLDYWRVIRIRKTVILAVFLLVVLTTTAVTFILPESYSSTVRISVEKDVSDINPLGFAQNAAQYDPYFIQTEFEKIRSKKVLYKVIEKLNLNERWGERYNKGTPFKTTETFALLSRRIDVRQTRNTSLIEVRVFSDAKSKPAEEASEIANLIAEVYKDTRVDLKRDMAKKGISALSERQKQLDEEVKTSLERLDKLRRDLQITDIGGEATGFAATLEPEVVRRLQTEYTTVQAAHNAMIALIAKLEELDEKGRAELRNALLTAQYDPQLANLLEELWKTEATLARQRQLLGDENSEIKAMAAMQKELSRTVNERIDGILHGLRIKEVATKAQLDGLAKAVEDAKREDSVKTESYRPYFAEKRELENTQKVRDAVILRILQEEVDAALPKTSIVEIVDVAEPGLRPVSPNFPLNLFLGVVVGLLVGVGLAFFIEYLDTSVKTIDDVERALQAPVLGVIPQNVGSLIEEGVESPHAEAYRVLRTNVLFSRKSDDANALTVVSGGAGEGKSTTIFNLATVFAQNGQRVLLVDSDLRRPSLHKIMNLSNSLGLTNFLLKQNTLEEVIQTTPVPSLDFLPSGKLPSSSLGILNSTQMKEFIQEAKRRYDFVFFDSPPIMGVSDASVLASEVDLALLVIQYRKYPQAMTLRAKQMVDKVGGNLLGVVLNNINISQDSYYYYYSGYYYDYYSRHKDEDGSPKKNGESKKGAEVESSRLDLKRKY